MNFHETSLPGVLQIELDVFQDTRGTFSKLFSKSIFKNQINFDVEDANASYTQNAGTFRGFHFQDFPFQEVKIVQCLLGSILDVVVDVRRNSSTYLQHISVRLEQNDNLAILIPEGFAHGFLTLSNDSLVHYLTNQKHMKAYECGLRFNDPKLDVKWPIPIETISQKDLSWPYL